MRAGYKGPGDLDSSGVESKGSVDFSPEISRLAAASSGPDGIFKIPRGVEHRMAIGLMASRVTPSVSLEPA